MRPKSSVPGMPPINEEEEKDCALSREH